MAAILFGAILAASLTACTSSGTKAEQSPVKNPDASNVMEAPQDNPVLDYSGTYVVTSIFRGDKECLDANYGEANAEHGGAYLAPCDGSETQAWNIRKLSPQLYQLVSKRGDEEICLNGNDRESPVHDGATFSEPCRTIINQAWTVEPTADGYIRLHSKLYADNVCLESNEAGSKVHAGSTFMDDCQEVTGQYWYLRNA